MKTGFKYRDKSTSIADAITRLSQKGFLVALVGFLMLMLIEFCIGKIANINIFVLCTYFAFLALIYFRDIQFLVEFFWVVILFTLNVVGVYICDEGFVLGELQISSYYCGALAPLVACYILFYGVIELYRLRKVDKRVDYSQAESPNLLYAIVALGFIIEGYLLSQVITHPYFIVGELRLGYAQQYMTPFAVSLRTYLPMFIPAVLMLWKRGNRKVAIAFFVFLAVFYFCEGDKFGTYLFAAYIITLCFSSHIRVETQKKVIKAIFALFCCLILVVYIQRILIFSSDASSVLRYLVERLSQQGEVWWSVYAQAKGTSLGIGEFSDELHVLFSGLSTSTYAEFGQWKMMSVAAHYSSNSQYRILVGNPYTATTTASVFYYFRWVGLFLFYVVASAAYASIVKNAVRAFSNGWVLESIIYVKLISILNTVLTASNIESLISFAGLFYIAALFALTLFREMRTQKSPITKDRKWKSGGVQK
ncbi:hypothetical protein [Gordonibacter pamelaeae]|uniref:hypothetical protein n=1 Tax=Gordonibacter pamelaeae TaxID=471189 RepID=UPI00242B559A|nr:hypothetical protein [Gordonibacter pamelaeae]